MDLDPTYGRPGTAGPARSTTGLATETRRGVTPPAVERAAVSPTTERASFASPGLRPAGEATRDVVVQLSQKALALARSASSNAARAKSVDGDTDGDRAAAQHRAERRDSTPRISVRA